MSDEQWLAANMVVSSFAIGALAIPVFQLGFIDSLLTIFFINVLAITPVCFFSTFGPRFGLRQMVLSRYYFGFHGVKISMFPPLDPASISKLPVRESGADWTLQSPSSMS